MTGSPDRRDPDRAIARELRLRAPAPAAVRLSRRAVAVTCAGAALIVAGVTGWALTARHGPAPQAVSQPPPLARPPEGLERLPRDYAGLPSDVPKLGPPLPGDLGGPILAAASPAVGSASYPAVTSERPAETERRQALASRLFAASASTPRAATAAAASASVSIAAPARPLTGSPHLIAGSTISAALVTGIRSDLPGPVVAEVTEDARDSLTGREVVVPKGSRLIGAYDSRVTFGQSRVLLTWSALILPDGQAVDLGKTAAVDDGGYAGLQDRVDRHWGQLFAASLVSLGVSAAGQLGRTGNDDIVRALRNGVSDTAAEVGGRIVGRSLEVQPTLTVRPGYPVRVLLTRDLSVSPGGG
jgi:type IV secretory pathway VirB10-like protein